MSNSDQRRSSHERETRPSVADAEQIIANLEAKRTALLERGRELDQVRASYAFAAHARDDKVARGKLDQVNRETAEHGSELASIDGALAMARQKLDAAKQHETKAADRNQALQLREHLIMFLETAHELDEALAAVAAHGNRLHELQAQMARCGAAVPNLAQLDSLGFRALLAACQTTPWARHFERLAPHERRSFSTLCGQWGENIARNIATRLGEQIIEAAE